MDARRAVVGDGSLRAYRRVLAACVLVLASLCLGASSAQATGLIPGATRAGANLDGTGYDDLTWFRDNAFGTGHGVFAGLTGTSTSSLWADSLAAIEWGGVGDFNNDGKDDLAWYDGSASAVKVRISAGTSFGVATTWLGSQSKPSWASVGDFNNDGLDDIAWFIANANPAIGADLRVFLNTGTSFTSSVWIAAIGTPTWAGVGDFTGDGKDDVAWHRNGTAYVLPSSGTAFGLQAWQDGLGAPDWAGVGDFGGDSKDDVVWFHEDPGAVSVLLSVGNDFVYSGDWQSGLDSPEWAGVGNFTGDSKDDLVWYHESGTTPSQAFWLLPNVGNDFTFDPTPLRSGVPLPDWAAPGGFRRDMGKPNATLSGELWDERALFTGGDLTVVATDDLDGAKSFQLFERDENGVRQNLGGAARSCPTIRCRSRGMDPWTTSLDPVAHGWWGGEHTLELDVYDFAGNKETIAWTVNYERPGFDIQLKYFSGVDPLTAAQQARVEAAAARWEHVITSDLPHSTAAGTFVDDLRIDVWIGQIPDAADTDPNGGNILAHATYSTRRSGTGGLPDYGYVEIDYQDRNMNLDGFERVVTHEIGHVLGIGTLWGTQGLLQGGGTSNPTYHGTNALWWYNSMLGGLGEPPASSVPVSNGTAGDGGADAHWRKSVFGNEVMTGTIDLSPTAVSPLSILTVGGLADLGYGVTYGNADEYYLPTPGPLRRSGEPEPIL